MTSRAAQTAMAAPGQPRSRSGRGASDASPGAAGPDPVLKTTPLPPLRGPLMAGRGDKERGGVEAGLSAEPG